ncbi:winged helix-turn-helix domain-containing protein [Paenibacillus tyrfis]|uniref:winged helix-turn-helix domain-containing protein n=1 Tax=Paenibacillus tyrfis TaxID=1501230 RepID=UPI00286AEE26|nr:winged helix-turn-helix domain-containing protein [Paenibacillus tyrfis]
MNLEPNVMTEYFYDDERKAIMVHRFRAGECLFCYGKEKTIFFKKFYICKQCIQSLPALQVFLARVERERVEEVKRTLPKKKKTTSRRKEALDRLHKAIKENPEASQKELAKMLGFSEAWVSKLLRNM